VLRSVIDSRVLEIRQPTLTTACLLFNKNRDARVKKCPAPIYRYASTVFDTCGHAVIMRCFVNSYNVVHKACVAFIFYRYFEKFHQRRQRATDITRARRASRQLADVRTVRSNERGQTYGRHLESIALYQKSDSVNRCVFT